MATDALADSLPAITDHLLERSNGTYDEAFVKTLVEKVAHEFDGARIHDYLGVLVAKEATDELRRLHALKPIAA